jgi:uncharacterized protein YjbK
MNPLTEIELKLVIKSNNPYQIIEEISQLNSIGQYILKPPETKKIRDAFFDTNSYQLRKNKIALRTRLMDNVWYITLKGKQQIDKNGIINRFELELPWCQSSLNEVLEYLSKYDFSISNHPKIRVSDYPINDLQKLGFVIIQDRITERISKLIVNQKDNIIIAEIALDSVFYEIQKRKIGHFEIEIEAKNEEGKNALNTSSKELLALYKDQLTVWIYNKLVTGIALESLFNDKFLSEFVNNYNNLKPTAYDELLSYLKENIN